MSEEGQGQPTPFASGEQPAGQQQNLQIFVDERDLRTVFCNFYQVHTTMEEVIIDLGYNMPNPRPVPQQQGGQPRPQNVDLNGSFGGMFGGIGVP